MSHSEKSPSCPPRMAPGESGFNIPPTPATSHSFNCELAARQIQWSASPSASVIRVKHSAGRLVVGVLSFAFNALAVTALAGLSLMASLQRTESQSSGTSVAVASFADVRAEAVPKLVVTDQQGSADQPLPLGILVKNGSGQEIVTISGLAEGIELSLGTPLGSGDWIVLSRDLQGTYVGSAKNLTPAIEALVKLYSPDGQFLDSQFIRFEWIKKTEETPHAFKLAAEEHPPKRKPSPFKLAAEEHALGLQPENELKQPQGNKLASPRSGDVGPQPSQKPSLQQASSRQQPATIAATGFRSPSGNIHCQAFKLDGGAVLRCDVRQMSNRPTPRPKNCVLDYGQAFEVTDKNVPAARICHGDTVMDPARPPLPYSATWQHYGFSCKSEQSGVNCVSARGHGFELSRGTQRVF